MLIDGLNWKAAESFCIPDAEGECSTCKYKEDTIYVSPCTKCMHKYQKIEVSKVSYHTPGYVSGHINKREGTE